jgi:hypothetical protein
MANYTTLVDLYNIITDYIDGILNTENEQYIEDIRAILSKQLHINGDDIDPIDTFTENYPRIIDDAKNMKPSEIKSIYNELNSVYKFIHEIWIILWDEQCHSFIPTKDYNIDELKEFAKLCGLTNYSRKNKTELIDLLNEYLQQSIR